MLQTLLDLDNHEFAAFDTNTLRNWIRDMGHELAQYHRTFAKIEEMLRSNYDMTFIALEIVNQKFEAVLYQLDDYRAGEARADTPFAALSALAQSVERKDSTP